MGSLLTPGLQLKQPFEMEEVSRVVGKLKRSQLALIDFEATQKKLNQIAFSFISFTAGGGCSHSYLFFLDLCATNSDNFV